MSESTASSDSGSGRESIGSKSRRQSKKQTYGSKKKPKRSKQKKQKGAGANGRGRRSRKSLSTSDSDLTNTFSNTDDDPGHSNLSVSLQQLKELLTSSRNMPKKAKQAKGKRSKGKQKGRKQSRSYKRNSRKKRKNKKGLKRSQRMLAVEASPILSNTSPLESSPKGASIQSKRPKSVSLDLTPFSATPHAPLSNAVPSRASAWPPGQTPPSTETFSPSPSPVASPLISKVAPTPPAPASDLASCKSLQAVSHAMPFNAQSSLGQESSPVQTSNMAPCEGSSVFSAPVRLQSQTSSSSSGEPASSTSSSHLDSPVRITPDDPSPPNTPRSFIGKGSTTSKMAASTCRRPPFGAPKRLPARGAGGNSSRTPFLRIAGTPPVRSGKNILPPPVAGLKVTRPVDPVPQIAGGTGPSTQGDKSQNKG